MCRVFVPRDPTPPNCYFAIPSPPIAKRYRGVFGSSLAISTKAFRGPRAFGRKRTVTPSIPPRVDYALTELGHSLRGPVEALASWATANGPAIVEERESTTVVGPGMEAALDPAMNLLVHLE